MTEGQSQPPRTHIIACDVLREEIEILADELTHIEGRDYLPMGLHDSPKMLLSSLQDHLAAAEKNLRVEAVVLIYGLCGNGTAGLGPKRVKLVLPRAHDCITLYMGSAKRYAACQRAQPDTYFFTPGWMRGKRTPGPERAEQLRMEYSERFDDPDDIDYLIEADNEVWARHGHAAYIDLGLPNRNDYPETARDCARWLGWEFASLKGDPTLLNDTLAGNWDTSRHLIVHPGESVQPAHDDSILCAKACVRQ